jgi:hypothetical protein
MVSLWTPYICGHSSSFDTSICVAYIASLIVKKHQKDNCNFEIGLCPQIRFNYRQSWEGPYDPIIKRERTFALNFYNFYISTLILHDMVGNR